VWLVKCKLVLSLSFQKYKYTNTVMRNSKLLKMATTAAEAERCATAAVVEAAAAVSVTSDAAAAAVRTR
jgi:hypothetical protein